MARKQSIFGARESECKAREYVHTDTLSIPLPRKSPVPLYTPFLVHHCIAGQVYLSAFAGVRGSHLILPHTVLGGLFFFNYANQ